MAETAGFLNPVGPSIRYSVFLLSIRTQEQRSAERVESAEKAPFSERPMVARRGGIKQIRERCVFSTFRLLTPTPERPSAMEAPFSELPMAATPGRHKRAERPKLFIAFRSLTRITERSAGSN